VLAVLAQAKEAQIKSAVLRSYGTRSQALRQVEASSEVQQHRVDDTILTQERKMRSYVDKGNEGICFFFCRPSFHILESRGKDS
jgi:hypothetical protein